MFVHGNRPEDHPLIQMRDEAFEQSKRSHERMRNEISLYANEEYEDSRWLQNLTMTAKKSLDPRIQETVNRLVPALLEQMPRMEVMPDRSSQTGLDLLHTMDLKNWLRMMEDADSEQDELKSVVTHNAVMGNGVSKLYFDNRTKIARALTIDPLMFAPDPSAARSNFSDSEYICHSNYHNLPYSAVKFPGAHLGDWETSGKDLRFFGEHRSGIRVDELWMKPAYAAMCGIKVKKNTHMVTVRLVNNRVYDAWSNVYWYPDFPFAHWKNFLDIRGDGRAQDFWGYGYSSLMEPQQRLLDEMLANYIMITRNLAVGRVITTHGTLDVQRIINEHGMNIELNPGKGLEDIEFLQSAEAPISLLKMIELTTQAMTGTSPAMNEAFAGQAPFAGASGKAIEGLQMSAFSELSANIRSMSDYRRRRCRIRLNHIQQFAMRPLGPHQWRGGLDLPDDFPEDARYIGFDLGLPDIASIPNTVQGRIQVLQFLASMGYMMRPDKVLPFLNLDRGFGIKAEDFIMAAPGGAAGGGQQPGAGGELEGPATAMPVDVQGSEGATRLDLAA